MQRPIPSNLRGSARSRGARGATSSSQVRPPCTRPGPGDWVEGLLGAEANYRGCFAVGLVRRGHELALGLAQDAPPVGIAGHGGHGLAVHADGLADAAHPAQEIAVVHQGLVAAIVVVTERLLEQVGGAVVVAGSAVGDGGLVQDLGIGLLWAS